MSICANCKSEHNGTYGSGRFCSVKCSRGFSTKAKRKEINRKVSKKLISTGHKDINKICPECKNSFNVKWFKRTQLFCGNSCATTYRSKDSVYIKKLSLARIKNIQNGVINGAGIKMKYKFQNDLIHCDSKIEYACLDYFVNKYKPIEIKRCTRILEYNFNTKIKHFLPDFEIKTLTQHFIIEAKGFMTINNINEKWRNYNEISIIKKKTLQDYCNENNFIAFWFTPDLNYKLYRSI